VGNFFENNLKKKGGKKMCFSMEILVFKQILAIFAKTMS
jgi:hypothetical protein